MGAFCQAPIVLHWPCSLRIRIPILHTPSTEGAGPLPVTSWDGAEEYVKNFTNVCFSLVSPCCRMLRCQPHSFGVVVSEWRCSRHFVLRSPSTGVVSETERADRLAFRRGAKAVSADDNVEPRGGQPVDPQDRPVRSSIQREGTE